MKSNVTWLSFGIRFFLLSVLLLLLSGCGGQPLFIERPQVHEAVSLVPARTNVVQVDPTNTVVVVTPATTAITRVTNIVFEPNPVVVSTLRTLQDVNGAVNPTPTSAPINWLLGGASTLLGAIATWKTRRASSLGTQLEAVVTGVETSGNKDIKSAIKTAAMGRRIEGDLYQSVQEITGSR